MSPETTIKRTAPLACTRCDDEDGPFTAYGLCEGCEAETASALRGLPGDSQ